MNEVSSDFCLSTNSLTVDDDGVDSFGSDKPFVESVVKRDGVCERDGAFEEHRDDGLEELRFSRGISSDVGREIRGLESLDFGVPECDRFLLPSLFGVLIGALPGFADELR